MLHSCHICLWIPFKPCPPPLLLAVRRRSDFEEFCKCEAFEDVPTKGKVRTPELQSMCISLGDLMYGAEALN